MALTQVFLKDITNSSQYTYLGLKMYWIPPDSLWFSSTVITLLCSSWMQSFWNLQFTLSIVISILELPVRHTTEMITGKSAHSIGPLGKCSQGKRQTMMSRRQFTLWQSKLKGQSVKDIYVIFHFFDPPIWPLNLHKPFNYSIHSSLFIGFLILEAL